MKLKEFFEQLYSNCQEGYLTITTLPERSTTWFPISDIESAVKKAELEGQITNTYFGVGLRREPLPFNLRGGSNDVLVIPALYVDIDIKGSAHVEEALPKTIDEAITFIKSLPLQPTFIVDSGNGLHGYWKLAKTFVISSDEKKNEISSILSGFGKYVNNEAAKSGWKLDAVYDLARVLRVPGTLNHKNENKVKCRVLEHSDINYEVADFTDYKDTQPAIPDRSVINKGITGSAERILEKCEFIKYCQEKAEKLPEPWWHAMISNIALTADGKKTIHDLSRPYPKYSKNETDDKIRRAVKENKPYTCRYIKESLGFSCQTECKVKAPVVYAVLTLEERVKNLVDNPDTSLDALYSYDVLSLLAFASEKLPAEYARFKAKIKGSVNLRDFEKAVRGSKISSVSEPKTNVPVNLKGINLNGAIMPFGWIISMEAGVQRSSVGREGTTISVVCPAALVIVRRLENIDDACEKIELTFFRNNRWKRILAPRSQIFSKTSIIKFADNGLPVSSDSAGDVVKFLWEYEIANVSVIPFVRSVGRIGWLGNEFFPCATDDVVAFESDYKEASDIMNNLKKQGDFEKWMNAATIVRQNEFSRFLLAASFASPLIEKLGHRVFFIHIWHDSKSGKTAAIKYAVSVWGNPQKLMGSFNATAVGLERMAGTLKHLPFAIDELQVLNEKRLSVETVVYSLGNGFGRMRGAKEGGLQDVPSWRNILITSGEQPMSKDTSNDGVITRVLELYGKPLPDESFAHTLHQLSESNFGFAGPVYIRYIIACVLSQKDKLKSDFERIYNGIEKSFTKSIKKSIGGHLDNIAIVCLGDYYASMAVFGVEEHTAFDDAINLGSAILENHKTLEKEDTVIRSWSFITQWVASNKGRFSYDAVPCYGAIEGNKVYININLLREALETAGFDYSKVTRGLKDRGFFQTSFESDGTKRMQVQHRVNGVNARWFLITLDLGDEEIEPLTGVSRKEEQ